MVFLFVPVDVDSEQWMLYNVIMLLMLVECIVVYCGDDEIDIDRPRPALGTKPASLSLNPLRPFGIREVTATTPGHMSM